MTGRCSRHVKVHSHTVLKTTEIWFRSQNEAFPIKSTRWHLLTTSDLSCQPSSMLVCLTAENLGKPCQHYGAGLLELFLRTLGMTIDSALFSLVPVVSNTEGQSHYPVAETMVESIA